MTPTFSPTSTKSVNLSSGIMMPLTKYSDPSAVPVMLLHGTTDLRQHLEFFHSSEPLHVFTHTQQERDNLERHTSEAHLQEFTKAVAALMGAVGLESALIVGTSARCSVVQHLARDYTKRTSGLVLMASFVAYHNTSASVAFYNASIVPLVGSIDAAFTLEFRAGTSAKPLSQALLETFIQASNVRASVDFVEVEVTRKLATMRAPTLVLWNNEDVSQPSLQASIFDERLMKNARGVLYGRKKQSVLRLISWQLFRA
jgi:pimeloyl-ACP methyl ester carboxylesterase